MGLGDKIDCWLYPELKRFENVVDGKQALRQCQRELHAGWRAPAVIGLAACLIVAWALRIGRRGLAFRPEAGIALALIILSSAFQIRYSCRLIRPRLRGLLAARGILLCANCGYDLTGNVSGTCPECGSRRHGGKRER